MGVLQSINKVLHYATKRPAIITVGAGLFFYGIKFALQDYDLTGTFEHFNSTLDQLISSDTTITGETLDSLETELPDDYANAEEDIGQTRFDRYEHGSESIDERLYEMRGHVADGDQSAAREEIIKLENYTDQLNENERAKQGKHGMGRGALISTSGIITMGIGATRSTNNVCDYDDDWDDDDDDWDDE